MIPAPAQFLLRLDDLCPTMHHERWLEFCSLIAEFALKPILAVIPDNRDPALDLAPPDPEFWNQLRALESTGAVIGLHGLHHVCDSTARTLLNLARTSEFAGVELAVQRFWIAEGLRLLRARGLHPRIFVAPRHGFDLVTLQALAAEKLPLLSDGFVRTPFLAHGVTWIPQQLWAPILKPRGLWTICMHPNTARDEEIEQLRAFLRARSSQFTSVDRLLAEFPPTTLTFAERVYASFALCRVKVSRSRMRAPRLGRISSSSR
jgi:predicted deacetylase